MTDERITTTSMSLTSAERVDYQPISGWAVFGVICGALMTAAVLGSVVLIVFSGNPYYLPGGALVLAIAGAVVSFIGRRQIIASEGTRTGMGLARAGIWLSVLSGLGYLTFTQITGLALQIQANDFMMRISPDDEGKRVPDSGFFPRLLKSLKDNTQYNCAFLLSVDDRDGASPQDETKMLARFNVSNKKSQPRLTQFRSNPMVTFIRDVLKYGGDPDKIKIEPLGVESWEFLRPEGKGYYEIRRNYRISTPEFEREFLLAVQSIEPTGPGDKRQWFLNLKMSGDVRDKQVVTPLGIGLSNLRYSVKDALTRWMDPELKVGRLKAIDKTNYVDLVPSNEKLRKYIEANALANLAPRSTAEIEMTPWREVDRRIEISYPVRAHIEGNEANPENYQVDGYITVQSDSPVDPAQAGPTTDPAWTNFSLILYNVTPVRKTEEGRGPSE